MPAGVPTPTLLVVDDDLGLLILIEGVLRAEKWNVVTAASGTAAHAWLQKNSADLLLLDLKLSDIEGREFIERVGAMGRPIPFIVITGQGDERVAVEMMKRGALDYLVKDVNFIDLIPTVVRRGLVQLERERRLVEAEKSLREERDFVSAVLETAGALVVVLDEAGRVVRFNRACEQVTGYSAAEVLGKPIWHLMLPPEEVAAVKSVFDQLRAERLPNHFENHWLTKAGERRLIAWANTLLTKPDGTVKHVIGTGLDITERRLDQQRRQLQYEMSRLLAASASLTETVPKLLQIFAETCEWDVGEFWDFTGEPKRLRMVYVWHAPKPKLAAYVKHSLKLSISLFDGLPGRVLATGKPQWIPDIAQCAHFLRRQAASRAGLRSALAFPIQLSDHSLGVMAFLMHGRTEPDEELLQMFTTLGSQIGQFMERKKAEEALREANQFGKQIIGGAQAGIIVYGLEGKVVVWNPFMEQITGYRSEEVLGRQAIEVFPFLQEKHFGKMFERASAGEVFDAADIPYDLPEKGKRGWTTARFAPLRDAQQRIVGVIVAVRDITDRRRLESELLEVTDREQQRIGHDLHDGLGQQLTGLEMKCFLFLQDLAAADLVTGRAKLLEQARQMNQVLRECITATRSIARGLAPVALKTDGLPGALEQLAHRTRVPGRIECNFVCRGPTIIDGGQIAKHLYRIAQEAVNNAIKHARTRRIDIVLESKEGVLRLQIKDNGRGLPRSAKAKTGMGLEVMRHRAHVIGASLEIDSKPGKGVRVTCTLPIKES